MDILTNIHAILFCDDIRRLPKSLRFYTQPGTIAYEAVHRTGCAVAGGRFLLLDVRIINMRTGKTLEDLRDMPGRIQSIALAGGNPSGLRKIAFFSESGNLILELEPDGRIKNRF